jgi:hypothetical protein
VTWNYRLVSVPDQSSDSGRYVMICEVFYDEQGEPYAYAGLVAKTFAWRERLTT